MFNYKIFIVITLTLGFFVQGQSNLKGTVLYKASYDKAYIDSNGKNEEGVKGANELIKNASDVYATLSFNDKESSYKVEKKLKADNAKLNIAFYFAGGEDLYYRNKDSVNLLQTNSSLGKTYLIERNPPNWTITKETKLIDGLLCIKAYSKTLNSSNIEKIDATAWFCPEISIDFGPMKYFGLPGLIIELQFSKMTFIAEKIDLNEDDVTVEKPSKAEILTPEEFAEMAKKKAPDFFEN